MLFSREWHSERMCARMHVCFRRCAMGVVRANVCVLHASAFLPRVLRIALCDVRPVGHTSESPSLASLCLRACRESG